MLGVHEAVLAHHEQSGTPVAGEATPWIAMLSRGRLEGDPGPAAAALAWLERRLRRERGSPFHGGGINLYDLYEVGMELHTALEEAR